MTTYVSQVVGQTKVSCMQCNYTVPACVHGVSRHVVKALPQFKYGFYAWGRVCGFCVVLGVQLKYEHPGNKSAAHTRMKEIHVKATAITLGHTYMQLFPLEVDDEHFHSLAIFWQ